MISNPAGRLAVIILMLVLQTLVFAIELLGFTPGYIPDSALRRWWHIKQRKWYLPLQFWISPIFVATIGVILVAITFSNTSGELQKVPNTCSAQVDADIAGEGVIIGAVVQVGTLLLVSMLGSFHTSATGTKELGAGLILTNFSLTIALLVRLGKRTLTFPDAIISAMIIDGQGLGLSIQLTAKETLTSRWQVGIVVITQLLSLITLPLITFRFSNGSLAANSNCECLTIFWWAKLGNCHASTPLLEQAILWTYFAWRCVAFVQASFHGLFNMWSFDQADKDRRHAPEKFRPLTGRLSKITCPQYDDFGTAQLSEYPATVSLMGVIYGIIALTSLATVLTTKSDLDIVASSQVDSVGQVTALVVAGATVFRAGWLFFNLFMHEDPTGRGFRSPFKIPRFTNQHPWLKPEDNQFAACLLPLGTLLVDYQNLESWLIENSTLPDETCYMEPADEHKNVVLSDTSIDWPAMETSIPGPNINWDIMIARAITPEVRTLSFRPSPAYIQRLAMLDPIKSMLKSGTKTLSPYLVTGAILVRGLILANSESKYLDQGRRVLRPRLFETSGVWLQIFDIPEPESWILLRYRVERIMISGEDLGHEDNNDSNDDNDDNDNRKPVTVSANF